MSDDTRPGLTVPKYLIEATYASLLQPSSPFGFHTKEEAARRRAEREAWEAAHPLRHRARKARRWVRQRVAAVRRALGEWVGGSTLHQDCDW